MRIKSKIFTFIAKEALNIKNLISTLYRSSNTNRTIIQFNLPVEIQSYDNDPYAEFLSKMDEFAKTIVSMGSGQEGSLDIPYDLINQLSLDDIENLMIATVSSPEQHFFIQSDTPQSIHEQFIDCDGDEYVIHGYNKDYTLLLSQHDGYLVVPNIMIAHAHANKEDSHFVSKAVIKDRILQAKAIDIAKVIKLGMR